MTHSTSTFSGWAATWDLNTNLHHIASDVELCYECQQTKCQDTLNIADDLEEPCDPQNSEH